MYVNKERENKMFGKNCFFCVSDIHINNYIKKDKNIEVFVLFEIIIVCMKSCVKGVKIFFKKIVLFEITVICI